MVGLCACTSPAARPTSPPLVTLAAPSPLTAVTLLDLVGTWRWQLATTEAGTARIEREVWRFQPVVGDAAHLTGRYVRDVDVEATDRAPFGCDQRPRYRQRAVFDVVATSNTNASMFYIHETGAQAEPSPCDHGFRHLGDYTGVLANHTLTLAFDNGGQPGTETLQQVDDNLASLPEAPWTRSFDVAGPWRWQSTSYDPEGNLRDETEWWEITHRGDTGVAATYRRRVTVRSSGGGRIACAGASSWSFDDAYVLTGQREEEHWHLAEIAVDPADHPCLRATPQRHLDEATAEQLGDYFVLEWRGKRKQVLYRPAPAR